MNLKSNILKLTLALLLVPIFAFAQVDFSKKPDDDLGNVEDEYQEFFFEALKQKGIENYQRAIDALQKCLNLDSSKPVLFYELGKNYKLLDNYEAAASNLKKAVSMQPDNEWILDELYDVYALNNDLDNAIATVKQLVQFHPDYKMDLATLYVKKQQYQDALLLLDELDSELGANELRDTMRNDIYDISGNDTDRIKDLEKRVAANPNNEENHLKLIYRYSEAGQENKAFQAAENWLQQKPDSKLVHLALYKFYMDRGQTEGAISSMKIVLSAPEINNDAKAKVLKDFVDFVEQNPQYEDDLLEVTSQTEINTSTKSLSDLGEYYLKSGDKAKALKNYKDALAKEPNNFLFLKNVLLLELDSQAFDTAEARSSEALELYPAQPILYLINGVAHNKLNAPKKAIEQLEMGLDFLIDDPKMEADFYQQLSVAYRLENNMAQSEAFAKKAEKLKAQN
ncbi:tetratricopeptide repeat protein [Winogradskyella maritima]|uniref:Tetratricopeptide repeat protein n=1 Tax=Winogradskyella maritima TaxID=1517766 RepID=A0ABV8AE41_9FLAO|nr:tetratricopeptide repeat protein [Winogradskyella maritima]